jgi:hypothetical protein
VLAVATTWLAARQKEQGRRTIDHDAPNVRATLRDAGTILDLELEAREVRDELSESRRVIFTPAPICESQSLRTVLPAIVHHDLSVTTREPVRSKGSFDLRRDRTTNGSPANGQNLASRKS